jgi:hypothetical protein
VLSDAQKEDISKDLATIDHWRCVYSQFLGREQELLDREDTLINVWEPAIEGHRIADGFHRLVAAKLAGLRAIGARLAPTFRQPPLGHQGGFLLGGRRRKSPVSPL